MTNGITANKMDLQRLIARAQFITPKKNTKGLDTTRDDTNDTDSKTTGMTRTK